MFSVAHEDQGLSFKPNRQKAQGLFLINVYQGEKAKLSVPAEYWHYKHKKADLNLLCLLQAFKSDESVKLRLENI